MNKTNWIRLRVTDEDKKIIYEKAKAFGMKVSDYIRFVSIHTNEIKKENIALNKKEE